MLQEQPQNVSIPISPMKKLKILSDNQNVIQGTKLEFATKFDKVNELDGEELSHAKKPAAIIVPAENDDTTIDEPLLKETIDQYVIFPIKYDDIWESYKKLVENFWSATDNLENLELLKFNDNEMKFLKYLTGFFALFDLQKQNQSGGGLINENFAEEFSKIIQITEAKFFYGHLLFVQNIHFEMFNKLYEVLVQSDADKQAIVDFEKVDAVHAKRELLKAWYTNGLTFGEKLIASACLHGILFSSLSLSKIWIDKRMAVQANHELVDNINRVNIDQDFARDFACLMVSYLKHKPSEDFLLRTVDEAARIERDFLLNALPVDLIGFKEADIKIHVDKRANLLKVKLLQALSGKNASGLIQAKMERVESNTFENKSNKIEQHQKPVFDEDF